jgi:hypothetical protein
MIGPGTPALPSMSDVNVTIKLGLKSVRESRVLGGPEPVPACTTSLTIELVPVPVPTSLVDNIIQMAERIIQLIDAGLETNVSFLPPAHPSS